MISCFKIPTKNFRSRAVTDFPRATDVLKGNCSPEVQVHDRVFKVPGVNFDIAINARIIAIAAIVLFCFLAGLVARTRPARSFVKSLESRLLSRLPAYAFIKGMTEKIAGIKNAGGLTPVLARSGSGWRMAFKIERIDNGNVAVYLPGAPNPWSGFVCFMAEADVKPLDLPVKSVLDTFESFGKGSGELLKDRL